MGLDRFLKKDWICCQVNSILKILTLNIDIHVANTYILLSISKDHGLIYFFALLAAQASDSFKY